MEKDDLKDDPFKEAEDNLGIKLHNGTKKIFMANGFDNSKIIARINEEDILNTEEFAKNTLVHIIEEDQYAEYFGIFKSNVSKFKLLDGHKKQLHMIIDFYNNQNNKKDEITPIVYRTKGENYSKKVKNIKIEKEMKVLNVNLPEEKKHIERNITEWIKQKIIDHSDKKVEELMRNIIVTVSLSNDTSNEFNMDTGEDTRESNDIKGTIKCYCGKNQTNVLKKVTSGHRKKIWILGNYYRHLITHAEFNLENKRQDKYAKKTVQQNKVHNYFTSVEIEKSKQI